MHIIDVQTFHKALKANGFDSIQALADKLGVHRNTIHHYLSGNPVIADKLELIMKELCLTPGQLFTLKDTQHKVPYEEITELVSKLSISFPNVILVLFGSRARKKNRKYSDFDIGVFSSSEFSHQDYLKMIALKDQLVEDLPFFVDLINLNQADHDFLLEISSDWKFLSGNFLHWINLQKQVLNG